MALTKYEQTLLEGWEEVHKKSQLTLWILLALKDGAKHMQQIKEFIIDITHGTINADDKSMYRALRRYHDADMISFVNQQSENGPDLKVYSLTNIGKQVLKIFVKRNIASIFYQPQISKLLGHKL